MYNSHAHPTLPQDDSVDQRKQRAFDLALARTAYNYMVSYMDPVPIAASVPKDEEFTPDYFAEVAKVFLELADNFEDTVTRLLLKELTDDFNYKDLKAVKDLEKAWKELRRAIEKSSFTKVFTDFHLVFDFLVALKDLPGALIRKTLSGASRLPQEITAAIKGFVEVFEQFKDEGFTAFLKSTLFDVLDTGNGREYLQALKFEDYNELFDSLPKPFNLELPLREWMTEKDPNKISLQDWYFGYLQTGGYNTTNLRGVRLSKDEAKEAELLENVLAKMPITDSVFQAVLGDESVTLAAAAENKRLFVCDYTMLDGIEGGELNGKMRYPVAPVALFYWNETPPEGYPSGGAMQPIAIQMGQVFDEETTPIFTPGDVNGNNDADGSKWLMAKMAVNNACAVQHETVAHLGACHLVVDPMIVAANRQLDERHPLLVLFKPHFRYTLPINNGAINSLIVPGGVVASVVSSKLSGSAKMIVEAHEKWRFDEQYPDKLFALRGVDKDALPGFPFREDTQDLWQATRTYIGKYLAIYYQADTDAQTRERLLADTELQAWINEMVNPRRAATKGMNGLTQLEDGTVQIDNLDYLTEVVSLIIYTASAQHASVNYAQYPLMTYIPSVSGTLYSTPPTRSDVVTDQGLSWLPPLDVALYQISFGWLLSGVQWDKLGHYKDHKDEPCFTDSRVMPIISEFQKALKTIESDIVERNRVRPYPYEFQLPSKVPNSISI
ncbi:Linoleate 9/13-lipoxygenase [BD1-7 clade bacterium]|nr:Linoleate 9/13-lipoxygenase [BD1-7 clade bacterium]